MGRALRQGCALLLLCAPAILLQGCAAIQPPRIESPSLYVLAYDRSVAVPDARRHGVIEVAAPRAAPGYDTPQMAYVRQPYELEYFAASRWADPPARMLGPLLVRALEQTGAFTVVLQMPNSLPADYRLDTELVRLQQDFAVRPSRAALTLRVQLVDVRAKRVLASRVFDDSEAASTEDAAGGVAATNRMLQRMLTEVADYCVAGAPAR